MLISLKLRKMTIQEKVHKNVIVLSDWRWRRGHPSVHQPCPWQADLHDEEAQRKGSNAILFLSGT